MVIARLRRISGSTSDPVRGSEGLGGAVVGGDSSGFAGRAGPLGAGGGTVSGGPEVGGAVVGGAVVGGVVEVVVGGVVVGGVGRGSSTVTVRVRPAAGATTQPGSATPHPGGASISSQQ